jgi:hypothetical protein
VRYVLIAAVSRYRDPALDLAGVALDSKRLRVVFERHTERVGGVREFLHLRDAEATRDGILAALDRLIEETRPDDQVVLYFGGHGHLAPGAAAEHERYVFLPHDATFTTATGAGLSTGVLRTRLERLRPREIVVIFDCCHGGGHSGEVAEAGWSSRLRQEVFDGWRAIYVMAATRGRELAGEVAGTGGFFLQALCEGLEGKAWYDSQGRISAQAAWLYASRRASRRAAELGHVQNPVAGGTPSDEIILTAPAHLAGEWFKVRHLRNPHFVGRDAELRRLHEALAEARPPGGDNRPTGTALTGMGGIGKTALAVEYVYTHRSSYPDGVFWVDAARPLLQVFEEVAFLLGILSRDQAAAGLAAAAFNALNSRPDALLVLDNIPDPSTLLDPVVPGCVPAQLKCHVLFTTRRRDLSPFSEVELGELDAEEALDLLLRHAGCRTALDPEHPAHAEACRITELLGRLPLALELAGAFLGELRPDIALADYRRSLQQHGCLVVVDGGDDPETAPLRRTVHEMAIAATLGDQFRTLTHPDDTLLLRVAGQLPESASIPMIRLGLLAGIDHRRGLGGLLPSPLEASLRRLVRACLIERLDDDRVRLHPLVREFAASQTPRDQMAALRRACAARLAQAYDSVDTLEELAASPTHGIDVMQDDLIAALDLCQEPGDGPA